ncbi:putative sterol 24-c-methyltransferase [Leptomonas seymouri]|uniref:Methyltransferase n=1 Tax=Leptomonas seymouri TaxID=5684 RepID=A0A0N0P458_LEPSE|nr:putative sterol 24-c-methyltransferase [Leptomonas seymouri]|eukprot:KPI84447.1 putative sterol 24-c-methyltransferase [Leptomonas seymouri]
MSAGSGESAPTNLIRRRTKGEVNEDVNAAADRFRDRFEKATLEERKEATTTMVNEYYDLVTDFYEYGWGQNFHFAPRYIGETFFESIARHEHFLAARGGFMEGDHIVDLGCGVGGPARNMVRLTRCNVTGVNNNEYQISRARRHDARAGMSGHIDYAKTDFCNMGFADNTFDGAYAIEATCHAKDKVKCYSEVYRVIKPGSCFVVYEWCMTDKYNPDDAYHRQVKHRIELGDGLPEMETCKQVVEYMKKAGFEVEESFDVIKQFETSPIKNIPWYQPLTGNYTTLQGLRATPIGRLLTNLMCRTLEFFHLAPKGTYKATEILEEAADSLAIGGQMGIFTPAFYVRGRKPASKK